MADIIIGFGTGRCGTKSLAKVLMRNPSIICTHESFLMPWKFDEMVFYQSLLQLAAMGSQYKIKNEKAYYEVSMSIDGGDFDVGDGIREIFESVDIDVGDVSFCWLNYLDKLFEIFPYARALGLIRNKDDTVKYWLKNHSYNYWTDGEGELCQYFPTYDMPIKAAIEQYWDDYNRIAEEVQARHKGRVAIVPMDWMLNDESFQRDMLSGFLGIRDPVVNPYIRIVGDGKA